MYALLGDFEHVRCLFDTEAAKEPQFDDTGLSFIDGRKSVQCIIQRNELGFSRVAAGRTFIETSRTTPILRASRRGGRGRPQ